jgi:type IV pilus assembly protein PilQ
MEKVLTAGLNAMEEDGKAKTLAHPSVITLDGEKATVSMQTSTPYRTGVDSNGNSTYSTVETGPKLDFTPVIGRDGVVTIRVNISAGPAPRLVGSANDQVPVTSHRDVETIVRVRNGEPFVVGGLYQDIKNSTRRRIPVLGYIPLLGDLFTQRSDTHTKTEAAIIVIPYILEVPDADTETFDLSQSSLSK